MKFWTEIAVSVVLASVLLSFLPIHGEEEIYADVLRLHVLAVSDTEEDQQTKLAVRDHVLGLLTPLLENAKDAAEAALLVEENRLVLTESVQTFLQQRGNPVPVEIQVTRESYPTRTYEDFALPAGDYLSCRVILGEGKGKNWWCVLFPSVCSSFATAETEEAYVEAGFTPEEYRLITHTKGVKYQVRFRLLEIFSEWTQMFK